LEEKIEKTILQDAKELEKGNAADESTSNPSGSTVVEIEEGE